MSTEAVTWALAQKLDRSSAKFVLVVMAECANAEMVCWPSMQHLADATCQDRKTVLENIRRLKDAGLISATDECKGRTGQVIVYRLNKSENGLVQEAQKRASTENVPVPKTEANSPVFPLEEARFSADTGPKTGHGTVKEPSKEPSGTKRNTAAVKSEVGVGELVLSGFDEQTAQDFIAHKRARKAPLTERAWKDHLRESGKAGWTPMQAAEKAMARNWSGFESRYVEGQRPAGAAPRPGKHAGFETMDYREGIAADGSIA